MDTSTAQNRTFVWRGTDRDGRSVGGEIESLTPALAKAKLRQQGVRPQSVKRKPKPLFGGGGKRIGSRDITVFARQLATMMKAGVPLVQSFDIVSESLENPRMRELVLSIKAEVASGTSFALSLQKYPQHFDELFVNPVGAGEISGTLDTMLDRVATCKEKSDALKARVRKALTYPVAVLAVALAVVGLLLVKVVPQFASTFSSFGAELPAFTQLVLELSDGARQWWPVALGALGLAVAAHRRGQRRSAAYRAWRDRLMLKLPVVGEIVVKSVVARFARNLATTIAAGVPLVEALDSVAGSAGNIMYAEAIRQVRDDVTTGASFHGAIKATGLFPPVLLQMVAIGEESGTLDGMLEKVATIHEEAVDNAVDSLSSLLEPLIMSVLGLLVGGVMVAMYLPVFMLGSVV